MLAAAVICSLGPVARVARTAPGLIGASARVARTAPGLIGARWFPTCAAAFHTPAGKAKLSIWPG